MSDNTDKIVRIEENLEALKRTSEELKLADKELAASDAELKESLQRVAVHMERMAVAVEVISKFQESQAEKDSEFRTFNKSVMERLNQTEKDLTQRLVDQTVNCTKQSNDNASEITKLRQTVDILRWFTGGVVLIGAGMVLKYLFGV